MPPIFLYAHKCVSYPAHTCVKQSCLSINLHMCAILFNMNKASHIMILSLILILILAQIELSTPSALLPRSTSVISHQFPIVFYVIRPIVESQLKEGGQVCLL